MRWLKRFLVGLLALLMVVMTGIYLIPLEVYVPEVERALSEQLQEPVSIQRLRIAALPLPHLELQEVRLGGQEGIAAQSIKVEPDLTVLLAGESIAWRILVQDGTASLVQVRKLAALFGGVPSATKGMAVRELQLSRMSLLTPGITLGPIEGKLEFARAGELERAWFAMDEQKVTTVVLPLPGRHFSVKAQAHAWALPQFPRLLLDDLEVEGTLSEQDFIVQKFAVTSRDTRVIGSGKVEFSDGWNIQAATMQVDAGLRHPLVFDQVRVRIAAQPEHLELNALEARLYGGRLSGMASINRKNSVLAAKIAMNGITMQPVVEALTDEVLFTGSMDSTAKFSIRLDALERFPENLQLTGNFHLRNGMLTKVDLAQVANSLGKTTAAGGTTRFDDLTGLLTVDGGGYHLRELKISSGSLNAEGKVDISPSLQLGGMLDTRVKGMAGLVSIPMVVSGTLNHPIVRPSGSALAGAAVGTAILGPGLGTAVGIKVGGFLNKLFGKNDDKNSKEAAPKPSPAK